MSRRHPPNFTILPFSHLVPVFITSMCSTVHRLWLGMGSDWGKGKSNCLVCFDGARQDEHLGQGGDSLGMESDDAQVISLCDLVTEIPVLDYRRSTRQFFSRVFFVIRFNSSTGSVFQIFLHQLLRSIASLLMVLVHDCKVEHDGAVSRISM